MGKMSLTKLVENFPIACLSKSANRGLLRYRCE